MKPGVLIIYDGLPGCDGVFILPILRLDILYLSKDSVRFVLGIVEAIAQQLSGPYRINATILE